MSFFKKQKTEPIAESNKTLDSVISGERVAPPPDLSTKPKDIIGYCFGFSCPNHHIGDTFDLITMDKYGEQKVCQTCGEISTPAIVKRTAEAQWGDLSMSSQAWCSGSGIGYNPVYGWRQCFYMSLDIIWTKHEFVKFLNDGKSVSA